MINKEEILRKAKKNSSRKRRLSLIFSLPVSLLSVFTAAVSTFAWYQASSASIEISGESTTTISVAAPEDVNISAALYSYKGNVISDYDPAGTFSGDYVSSGNQYFSTSLTGLKPGDKKYFAISVSAVNDSEESTDMNALYLKLLRTNITPGVASRRNIIGGGYITLANAIKIKCVYSANNTLPANDAAYTSDNFNYSNGNSSYTLLSEASDVSSGAYIFYYIEFANAPLYVEYTSNSGTAIRYDTPVVNNDGSDTVDRFFGLDNTNGNSNCYEKLQFSISDLSITTVS